MDKKSKLKKVKNFILSQQFKKDLNKLLENFFIKLLKLIFRILICILKTCIELS